MVDVIEENRKPKFSEKFSAAVGTGLNRASELYGSHQENKALKEMGIDLSGISDPDIRKAITQESFKQKRTDRDIQKTFGGILEEMRNLKEHTGPLNLAALNPYSETSGKRSQINTLRLSLEGLFRDLTLKGQFPKAIYERILKELPQASDTEEQYLNKIQAIESILEAHSGGKGAPAKSEAKGKMKFDPANAEHAAKFQQLDKQFKGDRQKVNEALAREFSP